MAIVVCFPKQTFCFSGSVILEHEVAPQRGARPGRRMMTEIQDVLVILPRMVARIGVQISNVCSVRCHREGLGEFVRRILEKSDKAFAGGVPSFAEEIKTT